MNQLSKKNELYDLYCHSLPVQCRFIFHISLTRRAYRETQKLLTGVPNAIDSKLHQSYGQLCQSESKKKASVALTQHLQINVIVTMWLSYKSLHSHY